MNHETGDLGRLSAHYNEARPYNPPTILSCRASAYDGTTLRSTWPREHRLRRIDPLLIPFLNVEREDRTRAS